MKLSSEYEKTIREIYGVDTSLQPTKEFIGGVELEIEGVNAVELPFGWHKEEDGSLRNEGMEFISPPSTRHSLSVGFAQVHKTLKTVPGVDPFSERTSIHVHVNCLDLTFPQTKSVLLWYALFEPVFFAMVKPSRRNNIHCVGLDQTVVSEHYRRTLDVIIAKWSKYTALNTLPLIPQGTIEFRHMHGHNDQVLFDQWLCTIENLWKWGQEYIMGKQQMSDEAILSAFDYIFKDSYIKSIRGNVLNLVGDNILDVKLSLV